MNQKKKMAAALGAFTNARGRPAVFLFLTESLKPVHVIQLRSVLGDHIFEEMDLVIHSHGGNIHAAY